MLHVDLQPHLQAPTSLMSCDLRSRRQLGKYYIKLSTLPVAYCTCSNLYAIAYIKDHPAPTIAEYKRIWDNLDPAIKKVSLDRHLEELG